MFPILSYSSTAKLYKAHKDIHGKSKCIIIPKHKPHSSLHFSSILRNTTKYIVLVKIILIGLHVFYNLIFLAYHTGS